MRASFSLYTRNCKTKKVWYARFHDTETGKVYATRSTDVICSGKKGNRINAYKKAKEMLKQIELDKSVIFIAYLESFWKQNSKYVKAKLLTENKKLSNYYIEQNAAGIKNHIKVYKPFQNLKLNELKPGMIEDWKVWSLERGTGARRVNIVLASMKVAVRYAVSRGDLEKDPFIGVKKVIHTPKEKGILTQEEIQKVLKVDESDQRVKVAFLLALFCGLRRGEVRGVKREDIDCKNKLIDVKNNYVDSEGLVGCKAGSNRKVILPESIIPEIKKLLELSEQFSLEGYLMFSLKEKNNPISVDVLRRGFSRVLKNIGINAEKQKERNLTFHGLRHSFVTMARMAGISDLEIQALAGHKTTAMMDHYSHAGQVIDFDSARERLDLLAKEA